MATPKFFFASLAILLLLTPSVLSTSPSPSPALSPESDSEYSPPSPTPSDSPFSSPPSPPPSDLHPSPSPDYSPSPSEKERSSAAPTPTPATSEESDKFVAGEVAEKEESSGMSGGKKAGIAMGVIAAAGVVFVGSVVYKKRQQNIRRSQYGSDVRRDFL